MMHDNQLTLHFFAGRRVRRDHSKRAPHAPYALKASSKQHDISVGSQNVSQPGEEYCCNLCKLLHQHQTFDTLNSTDMTRRTLIVLGHPQLLQLEQTQNGEWRQVVSPLATGCQSSLIDIDVSPNIDVSPDVPDSSCLEPGRAHAHAGDITASSMPDLELPEPASKSALQQWKHELRSSDSARMLVDKITATAAQLVNLRLGSFIF